MDDKRATVLKLFQEAKRPFTLKDVERMAAKAGVVQNTVKDVLKDLTDEVSPNFENRLKAPTNPPL